MLLDRPYSQATVEYLEAYLRRSGVDSGKISHPKPRDGLHPRTALTRKDVLWNAAIRPISELLRLYPLDPVAAKEELERLSLGSPAAPAIVPIQSRPRRCYM